MPRSFARMDIMRIQRLCAVHKCGQWRFQWDLNKTHISTDYRLNEIFDQRSTRCPVTQRNKPKLIMCWRWNTIWKLKIKTMQQLQREQRKKNRKLSHSSHELIRLMSQCKPQYLTATTITTATTLINATTWNWAKPLLSYNYGSSGVEHQ